MSMILVFNHHSLPCDSVQEAQNTIKQFVKVALKCRSQFGFELILIDETADNSWFNIEVAKGYCWRDWFNWAKQQADMKETVTAFRSLKTRQPMLLPEDAEQIELRVDVMLKGSEENLTSLQAAYWYKTFLISFPTYSPWNSPYIDTKVIELNTETNEVDEKNILINNLFDDHSLNTHREAIMSLRNERLQAGRDIWNKRLTFFPKLIFLDDPIKNQLLEWSHRKDILQNARNALGIMNTFVQRWEEGEFVTYQHEYLADCGLSSTISGESENVTNDPTKKAEREFWLPRGEKVYFQNHVKFGDGFRLHFYPDNQEKIIYIAYLGRHLKL